MKFILLTMLCSLAVLPCKASVAFYDNRDYIHNDPHNRECVVIRDQTGLYLKGFGGANVAREPRWHHASYRTSVGYVVGGAVGYHFDCIAIEGEFSYRFNSFDRLVVDDLDIHVSGDIRQYCGFANVLVGFPVTCYLAPYIGAGAGYRHMNPGVNFDESSDRSFRNFVDSANEWGVYQLIGGLNVAAHNRVNLHLEYRYVDAWCNIRCSNHTVDVGATLKF